MEIVLFLAIAAACVWYVFLRKPQKADPIVDNTSGVPSYAQAPYKVDAPVAPVVEAAPVVETKVEAAPAKATKAKAPAKPKAAARTAKPKAEKAPATAKAPAKAKKPKITVAK